MKTSLKSLGGLVLLTLATGVGAQEPTLLRYLPSKEPLIYRRTSTMKQTQTVMDKKIATEMNQTEIDEWSIAATDKKDLEIKSETKRLQVKVKIAQLGDYTFDSRKDDNDKGSTLGAALTPLYERMGAARLTYSVSPRGKIAKVEGLKELLEDVLKDNPIAKQFAAGGSDDAVKLGLAEFVPALPEDKITAGSRWEAPFEMNLAKLGKATGKRTYTYEGEGAIGKRKTVKIGVAMELSFDLNLDMNGAKVTGNLSISQSKGTIHFDAKQGCVVSLATEYTLGGNLNVEAGGMNIPVGTEQTQNIRLELLDRAPE
ncbi:MAG: DUF6263 family protein [Gemmataceae bacterium]|nr:DUF6263 family protein [Gemmataceae bacterium]